MVHRLRMARRAIDRAISELRAARGEEEYADIESDITMIIDDIRSIRAALDDLIREHEMLRASRREMLRASREETIGLEEGTEEETDII